MKNFGCWMLGLLFACSAENPDGDLSPTTGCVEWEAVTTEVTTVVSDVERVQGVSYLTTGSGQTSGCGESGASSSALTGDGVEGVGILVPQMPLFDIEYTEFIREPKLLLIDDSGDVQEFADIGGSPADFYLQNIYQQETGVYLTRGLQFRTLVLAEGTVLLSGNSRSAIYRVSSEGEVTTFVDGLPGISEMTPHATEEGSILVSVKGVEVAESEEGSEPLNQGRASILKIDAAGNRETFFVFPPTTGEFLSQWRNPIASHPNLRFSADYVLAIDQAANGDVYVCGSHDGIVLRIAADGESHEILRDDAFGCTDILYVENVGVVIAKAPEQHMENSTGGEGRPPEDEGGEGEGGAPRDEEPRDPSEEPSPYEPTAQGFVHGPQVLLLRGNEEWSLILDMPPLANYDTQFYSCVGWETETVKCLPNDAVVQFEQVNGNLLLTDSLAEAIYAVELPGAQ